MTSAGWDEARDQLVARLASEPAVRLVDIGLDEDGETVVVRVHVAPGARLSGPLPAEVAGLPVRLVPGDYRPQ